MFKNARKVTKLDKMIIISRYNKLKHHSKNLMNERGRIAKTKIIFQGDARKCVTSLIIEPNPHWVL